MPLIHRHLPCLARLRSGLVWMLFGAWLLASPTPANAATEYDVKAVYLLNFAKSVSWSSHAFPNAAAPVVIGVLGSDPFGGTLKKVCHGETARGRPIKVVHARNVGGLANCHIVFVSKSEAGRVIPIVSSFSGKPKLLVGDFAPFASLGGHLNFVVRGGSVRYEFNAGAAKKNGIKLPSKIQKSGKPSGAP